MAIVTILLSCTLGAIAGLFQFAVLGASAGQAFLSYVSFSVLVPATIIGTALVIDRFRFAQLGNDSLRQDVVETWQDWQAEEAMDADRIRHTAEGRLDGAHESRQSNSAPALTMTRPAPTTAYNGRRAGKA